MSDPVCSAPCSCSRGECPNQLIDSVRQSFDDCLAIVKRKNHDYAGARAVDQYANFRTAELLGLSVEKGIMVRWLDKLKRVDNLLSQEAYVTDESIEDTLRDAINYPAILLAYLQAKKMKPQSLGDPVSPLFSEVRAGIVK